MTRTELINLLIKSHGLKSYLEIGTQSNRPFDKIVAEKKVSVDPDPNAGAMWPCTSDVFFMNLKHGPAFVNENISEKEKEEIQQRMSETFVNRRIVPVMLPTVEFKNGTENKFDIIFIDGDHSARQVEKDIVNSMSVLNNGGFIVLHDCNPKEEWQQLVPRQHKVWYGDVWRAFVGFRIHYPQVKSYLVDHDCGCGIIHFTKTKLETGFSVTMPWYDFAVNRERLLGII
jgi:hypothetical protein